MGPISKNPSGRNLSPEEKEKLLRQLQESDQKGSSSSPIGMSGRSLSSLDLNPSSPMGLSGTSLKSSDVGKSFPIGMGGASYGTGVPTFSRSRSRVWWIAGIVFAAVVIVGIWLLFRRFV